MPKISSKGETLQRTTGQVPEVLVPHVIDQLVDVPKIVFQDGTGQWQPAGIPFQQVVEESDFKAFSPGQGSTAFCYAGHCVPQMTGQLEEGPKMVSQNRIEQRTAEQIVDMPAPVLQEQITERICERE